MNKKDLLASLSLLLIGCTEQNTLIVDNDYWDESNIIVNSSTTRFVGGNDSDSIYFVSDKDLDSYIQFKKLSQNKEDLIVLDISPIMDEYGEIWAYAINYSEGWELISADKRYRPVIGQSPVGYFKYEEQIEPIAEWLESYSEDIELLRHSENLGEVFSESSFEQMASYQEFWDIITANQEYIEANRIKTKALPGTGGGTWVLSSVFTDTVGYQRVDHLITTHWHQYSPYNAYCPLTSYSSVIRAPAGCVAIAGAQAAYYLHGKLGRPAKSPLNVFCSAQIPSSTGYYQAQLDDPQMYAYNNYTTAWSQMEQDDNIIAALVAYIGIRVSMVYEDWQSSSNISSLIIGYFIYNGINCSYDDLNNNSVYSALYNNILNEMPVVARAYRVIDGESDGHAFVIDGYKNERVRITSTYTWVPDDPQTPSYYDDRIEIMYTLPFNHQITMNWGWGNDYPYDDGWYSPAGDWHVVDYNYNHNKQMIYNFHNTP